jgi:hypothetical protein
MPNANETIFIGTVLRIEKLNGFGVSPEGLGFFEPNSMFPVIRPVFALIPLKSQILTVFYCIYRVNSEGSVEAQRYDHPVE